MLRFEITAEAEKLRAHFGGVLIAQFAIFFEGAIYDFFEFVRHGTVES